MNNLNTTSEVTLVFTDQLTGKTRTRTSKNRLDYGAGTLVNLEYYPTKMALMKIPINAGAPLLWTQDVSTTATTLLAAATNMTDTTGPWYWEAKHRFQSTGTSRPIYGILNSRGTATKYIKLFSHVALETPDEQGPTEVLDITYRVIYEDGGLTTNDRTTILTYLQFSYLDASSQSMGYLHASSGIVTDHLKDWGEIGCLERISLGDISEDYSPIAYKTWSIDKATTQDRNLRMLFPLNDATAITYRTLNDTTFTGGLIYSPIITANNPYPNYPVGPMYNHAVGSKYWAEDLNYLATSKGYPLASKTSSEYMNPITACDHHALVIADGGNVGVATYGHLVARADGCIGSTYGTGYAIPLPTRSRIDRGGLNRYTPHTTQPDPYGPYPQTTNPMNVKVYNSQTVVGVDYTDRFGLSIHNVYDNNYHYFDEFTAPGLPVGIGSLKAFQLARDVAGSVYIPAGSDLVKIANPLTTPTISTISSITIGITGTISAVGHCASTDRLYIHSDIGVSHSDDLGSTWVHHGAWTYVGESITTNVITNTTMSIVVNPLNQDEIALGFQNEASKYYSAWYNGSTQTVTAPSSYASLMLHDNDGASITCDPIKGIWMYNSNDTTSYQYGYLTYGQTTFESGRNISTNSSVTRIRHNVFSYDRFFSPLILRPLDSSYIPVMTALTPTGNSIGGFYLMGVYNCSLNYGLGYDVFDGILIKESGLNSFISTYNTSINYYTYISNASGSYFGSTTYQEDDDILTNNGTFSLQEPGLYKELCGYNEINKWDASEGVWKRHVDWSVPVAATADGSSSAVLERVHCTHNTTTLTGRSYFDMSNGVEGVDYGNTGLTLLATYTPMIKKNNTKTTDKWNSQYPTGEGVAHTCFDLRDSITGSGIVLMWRNNDLDTVLYDHTTPGTTTKTLIKASGVEGETRIGLTLNATGTTARVTVDGINYGGDLTLNQAMPMDNTGGRWSLHMGSRQHFYEIDRPYEYDFFKGDIDNIQVWNRVVTNAEYTTDNAGRSGLITGSGLVVRYLMDTPIVETKPTSSIDTVAPYGLIHRFPEGDLTAPSYVEGEAFNTVVSRDSIAKGNVVSLGGDWSIIPHHAEVSAVTSITTGNSISTAIDQSVTEYATWCHSDYKLSCVGGRIGESTTEVEILMEQSSEGDLIIEFEHTFPNAHMYMDFYIKTVASGANTSGYLAKVSYDDATNAVLISFANTADNYTINDPQVTGSKHRLSYLRATNTFEFHIDVGAGYVQYGTSVVVTTTTEPVMCNTHFRSGGNNSKMLYYNTNTGMHDCMVTYSCPGNVFRLGDKSTGTGLYAKNGRPMNAVIKRRVKIYLDGTPAEVVWLGTGIASVIHNVITEPGKVYLSTAYGMILLDPSDVGKEVTCDTFSIVKSASD